MKINKKQKIIITIMTILITAGILGIIYASQVRADAPVAPQGIRRFKSNVTVNLTAIDNETGVDYTLIEVWYRLNEAGIWNNILPETNYTGNIVYTATGFYQVHYYSVDNAGNRELRKSQDFQILGDTNPPYTRIILTGDEI